MADLDVFRRRIATVAAKVEVGVERAVRKAAFAADQAVVLATPVDTGRARSNWIVSLNEPDRSVREAHAPGTEGKTGGENARRALEQGSEEISRYRATDSAVYISNNLPYIQTLNDGHSAQAPAGFVEAAVRAAQRVVREARVLKED